MVSMLEFRVPEPGISLKAHYQRYYKVRPGAYRVVVAGAGGVGKSALTVRFIQGKFVMKYDPTIEDSYRKIIEIGGSQCVVDIMDTAGAEEYSALRDCYLKTGQGFVLVYSIISRTSFEYINKIRSRIMRIKEDHPYVPMILVGNKCDCESERVVSREEAAEFARKHNMGFVETSAWTGIYVEEMFYDVTRYISSMLPAPQKKKKKFFGWIKK